jgi:hypothetical protein
MNKLFNIQKLYLLLSILVLIIALITPLNIDSANAAEPVELYGPEGPTEVPGEEDTPDPEERGGVDGTHYVDPDNPLPEGVNADDSSYPIVAEGGEHDSVKFNSISAGGTATCGVRIGGVILCWGARVLSAIPTGLYTQVSVGDMHACALRNDNYVICWGDDYWNQSTPPAVTFTQVSAGDDHSCGIKTNGMVACWGRNEDGERNPPTGAFTQVSAGSGHTCGVRSTGALACWGRDDFGQSTPPGGIFTQISSGRRHNCGLKNDDSVVCWGIDSSRTTPPSGSFSQISAGEIHNCGIKSNGSIECWGSEYKGNTIPPAGIFAQLDSGGRHNCALNGNGVATCWGDDWDGQLIVPTFPPPPVLVGPNTIIYLNQPAYQWNIVDAATDYHLFVQDLKGNTLVSKWYTESNICRNTSCLAQPVKTLTPGEYRWKVRSKDSIGTGNWSDWMQFTVSRPIPVTLFSPNGIITDSTPWFHFSENRLKMCGPN